MTNGLIILLELGLFSLLLLLAFRVISLNRNEPMTSSMPAQSEDSVGQIAESLSARPQKFQFTGVLSGQPQATHHTDKCELISRLHILASLQIRDSRQQGLDLDTAHSSVREYTVCWLYGAACAFSRPGPQDSALVAAVVGEFASRKIGIRQSDAIARISTLTRCPASLACFRSGVEGAEFWQVHHFIPREKSLFEAVTSNAFV